MRKQLAKLNPENNPVLKIADGFVEYLISKNSSNTKKEIRIETNSGDITTFSEKEVLNFVHESVCRKLKCRTQKAFLDKYNQSVKSITQTTGLTRLLIESFAEYVTFLEQNELAAVSEIGSEKTVIEKLITKTDDIRHKNVRIILLLSKKKIERDSKDYEFVKRSDIAAEFGLAEDFNFKDTLESAIYELIAQPIDLFTAADLAFKIAYPKTFKVIIDSILNIETQLNNPHYSESLFRKLTSNNLQGLPIYFSKYFIRDYEQNFGFSIDKFTIRQELLDLILAELKPNLENVSIYDLSEAAKLWIKFKFNQNAHIYLAEREYKLHFSYNVKENFFKEVGRLSRQLCSNIISQIKPANIAQVTQYEKDMTSLRHSGANKISSSLNLFFEEELRPFLLTFDQTAINTKFYFRIEGSDFKNGYLTKDQWIEFVKSILEELLSKKTPDLFSTFVKLKTKEVIQNESQFNHCVKFIVLQLKKINIPDNNFDLAQAEISSIIRSINYKV
ncbi:MAG: hypothetical protein OHK0017_05490 [Patescibacteria group bacterium]